VGENVQNEILDLAPPDFGETHVGPTIQRMQLGFGAGSAAGETPPSSARRFLVDGPGPLGIGH